MPTQILWRCARPTATSPCRLAAPAFATPQARTSTAHPARTVVGRADPGELARLAAFVVLPLTDRDGGASGLPPVFAKLAVLADRIVRRVRDGLGVCGRVDRRSERDGGEQQHHVMRELDE